MAIPFADRSDAGRALAERLMPYAARPDVLVLALPRGGVPVAFEVAQALGAPMDVFLVRKLGVPGHEELAMGAIASGAIRVLDDDVIDHYGISKPMIDAVTDRQLQELRRREAEYRDEKPTPQIHGRILILVDDGLATGSTMRAAVLALRRQQPQRIVVAAPVGAPQTCDDLRAIADEVVCLHAPEGFTAVGQWYRNFSQTTDDQVRELLARASSASCGSVTRDVSDLADSGPPSPR